MKQNKELSPEAYLTLLKKFIQHRIGVKEFEKSFWDIWRYHQSSNLHYARDIEVVLSTLMLDVDHYCEPELADYDKKSVWFNITEEELYVCVQQALEKLEKR